MKVAFAVVASGQGHYKYLSALERFIMEVGKADVVLILEAASKFKITASFRMLSTNLLTRQGQYFNS